MKKSHLALSVTTLCLTAMSLPALALQDDPPPPKILSVTPFSLKKASGRECPDAGRGCVITIFEDGTVTATDVG